MTAIDPVCGMEVEPELAAGSALWHETVYYFCSPGCLKRFEADPGTHAGDRLSA